VHREKFGFSVFCGEILFQITHSYLIKMRISYNWLRDFVKFDFTPRELAEG